MKVLEKFDASARPTEKHRVEDNESGMWITVQPLAFPHERAWAEFLIQWGNFRITENSNLRIL